MYNTRYDGWDVHRCLRKCSEQCCVKSSTCIVGEGTSIAVKNEPPFLPGLDLSSHFDQVAAAGLLREGQVVARVGAVARRLDVSPQVKVVLSHWQVPGQRPGLEATENNFFAIFLFFPRVKSRRIAHFAARFSDERFFLLLPTADSSENKGWWIKLTQLIETMQENAWNTWLNVLSELRRHILKPKDKFFIHVTQYFTFLTCALCFSRSFTSRSISFCLLLVSSWSFFSSSSLLFLSSSRACFRMSISRSWTNGKLS